MKRMSVILLITLVVHATLPSHLSARAEPTQTAANPEVSFMEDVTSYFEQYHYESEKTHSSRVLSTLFAAKVQHHVFKDLKTLTSASESERVTRLLRYQEQLQTLDRLSATAPEAVIDLARKLQFHWEAHFAAEIGQRAKQRSANTRFLTQAGGTLGMIALGVLLAKSPHKLPHYFRLIRHALPIAGATAGYGLSDSLPTVSGNALIPAPAHLMTLGLPSDTAHTESQDDQIIEDFIALTSGVAAGAGTLELWTLVRASRALNAASAPLKITPYGLAASVLVGAATEYGVRGLIHHREKATLRAEIQDQWKSLSIAFRAQDRAKVIVSAERLKRAIVGYSLYLWTPIIESTQEFDQALLKTNEENLAQKPVEALYQKTLKDFRASLKSHLDDLQYEKDTALAQFLTLKYLSLHREGEMPRLFFTSMRSYAKHVQSEFSAHLTRQEENGIVCLSACSRENLFQAFVHDRTEDQRTRNTENFLKNGPSTHVGEILLQGVALLQSHAEFRDFTQGAADELLALVEKNHTLLVDAGTFEKLSNRKGSP